MKTLNLGMTGLMLAIFVVMVGVAATYPADARFMPFVVGIPAIALCVLQLSLDLRQKPNTAPQDEDHNELAEAEERIRKMTGRDITFDVAHDANMPHEEILSGRTVERREKTLWFAVLGLLCAVILIGFHVAIPVFIIAFLRHLAGYGWTRAIVAGAIGSAVIIGIFEFVLRNELFRGLLTTWALNAFGG